MALGDYTSNPQKAAEIIWQMGKKKAAANGAVMRTSVVGLLKENDEGGILWNDPAIGVEWPMPEGMTQADLILSDKDKVHGGFDAYCKERGIVR